MSLWSLSPTPDQRNTPKPSRRVSAGHSLLSVITRCGCSSRKPRREKRQDGWPRRGEGTTTGGMTHDRRREQPQCHGDERQTALQSEVDARAACLWPGTRPCTRASGPRGPQDSQANTPGGGQGKAPQLMAKGEALGAPVCTLPP